MTTATRVGLFTAGRARPTRCAFLSLGARILQQGDDGSHAISSLNFLKMGHFKGFSSRWCATSTRSTPDPMARRPTKVCDPYGQGGKPLGRDEATGLLATLENGWTLESRSEDTGESNKTDPPLSVCREFNHPDFLSGSKFCSVVAAVGHNNNHYPTICLERRLMKGKKAWRVVTTVKCSTETLGGLSFNDFHVAMMVDVEAARPDVHCLLSEEKAT